MVLLDGLCLELHNDGVLIRAFGIRSVIGILECIERVNAEKSVQAEGLMLVWRINNTRCSISNQCCSSTTDPRA